MPSSSPARTGPAARPHRHPRRRGATCSRRSPRAGPADFRTCPLMYRFRTIDRLPEEPSPGAMRGDVVHKVLEDLFDLPAAERTPERAAGDGPGRLGVRARRRARARCHVRRGSRGSGDGPGDRRLAGLVPGEPAGLLRPRGPTPARARRARGLRRGAARLAPAAAWLRRPHRHRSRRLDPGGGLQDGPLPRHRLREQGPVPDAVLRAGHLADPRAWCRSCCS